MGIAQTFPQTALHLPVPGKMLFPSTAFRPVLMKGLSFYPDHPLQFDFILDTGEAAPAGEALRQESTKLIKYFLASLTVPEDELWVNLSPHEKDRIMPQSFGVTEMGRDLLAQDYLLKQLTASLIYPENELGKQFWQRVYAKVQEAYGITNIPMDTFNKVWVVPVRAVIYQHENRAFVADTAFKVMLEEDYFAKNSEERKDSKKGDATTGQPAAYHLSLTTQIIKEIVIPELTKEVNEGKTFAPLRQIFHSMLLATWYKENLKESLLGKVYVDQGKTRGVDVEDKEIKQKIYAQYLEAFKKGVFNYIKEDYDPARQTLVPKKYFSGGLDLRRQEVTLDEWEVARAKPGDATSMRVTSEGIYYIVKREEGELNATELAHLQESDSALLVTARLGEIGEGATEDTQALVEEAERAAAAASRGMSVTKAAPIIIDASRPALLDKSMFSDPEFTDEDVQPFGFPSLEQFPRLYVKEAGESNILDVILGSNPNYVEDPEIGRNFERVLVIPGPVPFTVNGLQRSEHFLISDQGQVLFPYAGSLSTPITIRVIEDKVLSQTLRIEFHRLMARAVQVDKSLIPYWETVQKAWQQEFPLETQEEVAEIQHLKGTFSSMNDLLKFINYYYQDMLALIHPLQQIAPSLKFNVVIQHAADFYEAEPTEISSVAASEIRKKKIVEVAAELEQKLKAMLNSPDFNRHSTYQVFFEDLLHLTLRLVAIPPVSKVDLDLTIKYGREIANHTEARRAAEIISAAFAFYQNLPQDDWGDGVRDFFTYVSVGENEKGDLDLKYKAPGTSFAESFLFAERPISFIKKFSWKYRQDYKDIIKIKLLDQDTLLFRFVDMQYKVQRDKIEYLGYSFSDLAMLTNARINRNVKILTAESSSARTRLMAIARLKKIKDPGVVGPIAGALNHGNLVVVQAAAEALGHTGYVQAIDPLEERYLAGEFNEEVQQAIETALKKLKFLHVVQASLRQFKELAGMEPLLAGFLMGEVPFKETFIQYIRDEKPSIPDSMPEVHAVINLMVAARTVLNRYDQLKNQIDNWLDVSIWILEGLLSGVSKDKTLNLMQTMYKGIVPPYMDFILEEALEVKAIFMDQLRVQEETEWRIEDLKADSNLDESSMQAALKAASDQLGLSVQLLDLAETFLREGISSLEKIAQDFNDRDRIQGSTIEYAQIRLLAILAAALFPAKAGELLSIIQKLRSRAGANTPSAMSPLQAYGLVIGEIGQELSGRDFPFSDKDDAMLSDEQENILNDYLLSRAQANDIPNPELRLTRGREIFKWEDIVGLVQVGQPTSKNRRLRPRIFLLYSSTDIRSFGKKLVLGADGNERAEVLAHDEQSLVVPVKWLDVAFKLMSQDGISLQERLTQSDLDIIRSYLKKVIQEESVNMELGDVPKEMEDYVFWNFAMEYNFEGNKPLLVYRPQGHDGGFLYRDREGDMFQATVLQSIVPIDQARWLEAVEIREEILSDDVDEDNQPLGEYLEELAELIPFLYLPLPGFSERFQLFASRLKQRFGENTPAGEIALIDYEEDIRERFNLAFHLDAWFELDDQLGTNVTIRTVPDDVSLQEIKGWKYHTTATLEDFLEELTQILLEAAEEGGPLELLAAMSVPIAGIEEAGPEQGSIYRNRQFKLKSLSFSLKLREHFGPDLILGEKRILDHQNDIQRLFNEAYGNNAEFEVNNDLGPDIFFRGDPGNAASEDIIRWEYNPEATLLAFFLELGNRHMNRFINALGPPDEERGAGEDSAMLSGTTAKRVKDDNHQRIYQGQVPGGIDLNPALFDLQIKRDARGLPLPLNEQPVESMKIDGFLPIIINIQPVSIPLLLGLKPSPEKVAGAGKSLNDPA